MNAVGLAFYGGMALSCMAQLVHIQRLAWLNLQDQLDTEY